MCTLTMWAAFPTCWRPASRGPILCSEPSARLLPAMLEDALKIGYTRDYELIERVLGLIRRRTRARDQTAHRPSPPIHFIPILI